MEEVRSRLGRVKDPKKVDALVRTAVLAGARVVRDRARQNAPIRTGDLKKDIIARTRRRRRGDTSTRATVTIKPKSRSRHIAHLVEFGTDPHEQKKLNKVHPGAKAKPFLRPAADENDKEIFDAVVEKARERLGKLNV
jgi:HK97 gp10 family phage protein